MRRRQNARPSAPGRRRHRAGRARRAAGGRGAPSRRRFAAVAALVAGGLGLAAVAGSHGLAAQEPDPSSVRLGLTYEPGYLPALVVAPVRGASGLEAAAEAAAEILRTDLDFSDRFEIVPVPDSLSMGGAVNYGLWNQLGAVWLVTADVSGTPGAPILRVGLHDVVYGSLANVQAFSLPPVDDDGFRMAVHRAADAVVGWATDGEPGIAATRIAFRRRGADGTSALYVVDSDGGELHRIEAGARNIYSPAFSPDGSRIAYTAQDEDGRFRLMEVSLVTGRARTIERVDGVIQTPAFTPNGRLAYARTAEDGSEIFLEGNGQLTRGRGDALNPTFSPDGRRFAYEATPLGQQQVYVRDVAGGSPRLISRYLANERSSAGMPDWSPTGERIAYSAYVDGVFQVFSVNPNGTDRRMLTSRGRNEEPSWAPDGRHLVFTSLSSSGRALLILDTVTGRTRVLVSGQVDELPDWSAPLPAGR